MRMQRFAVALTVISVTILLLIVVRAGSTAQPVSPILRTRAFELVDERGQVQARLNVEAGGEVVLRLFDKNGTIRVKLGAGMDGSGLVLNDETTEPGVHIIARRSGTPQRPITTRVTLTGADGRQRVISP